MKGQRPSAVQKKWREDVRALGSILSGLHPVEIHHCAGRTAAHDKVHIGHWWILPLTSEEHARYVPEWGKRRKFMEKTLFGAVCKLIVRRGGVLPFGDDVATAIQEYRR